MCFSSPSIPQDNSAQVASQQEATKEANVTQGANSINSTFDNEFTPDYYNNIEQNYENYYDPQVTQQYNNALNTLTYQLGQQGILQSSEAARQEGLLNQNYGTENQSIANNALSASTQAQQQVATEKNNLLSENETAADPSLAAEQAAAGSLAVQSTPTYSPLGNVFAGLVGQGTNALGIQAGGLPGSTVGAATYATPTNTAALGQQSSVTA